MTTTPSLPDVVLCDMPWVDAVRRGGFMPSDRLVSALLGNEQVERVLVANPYRSAIAVAARWFLGQGTPALPGSPPGRTQWTPLRVARRDSRSPDRLERSRQAWGQALGDLATSLGFRQPVVITADPFTAAFADLGWARAVTYYAWDDWAVHPAHQRHAAVHAIANERIRRRGTRVVAVSEPILDRVGPTGAARVVPNGVEPSEWAAPDEPPGWFLDLPRPRLAYVGSVDDRLDAGAIEEVAARFPSGSVVLVGPHAGADVPALSNVVHHGPVGRAEIAALLAGADVGILPHRRTPLTSAMSPLKVYEYLAAGLPVVATDLPPVRGIHPAVRLVPEGGSFAEVSADALSAGRIAEADRRRFIHDNSWSRRVDEVLSVACGRG